MDGLDPNERRAEMARVRRLVRDGGVRLRKIEHGDWTLWRSAGFDHTFEPSVIEGYVAAGKITHDADDGYWSWSGKKPSRQPP